MGWYNMDKRFWKKLITYFPLSQRGPYKNKASTNYFIVENVYVAAIKFLPSCCLATTEGQTYRHTDLLEGCMKYPIEMDSSVMMCVPSFIKIDSGIQKLILGLHRHTDFQIAWRIHKPTFIFQTKEIGLKISTRETNWACHIKAPTDRAV
jgi:hypothetical protein